MNTAHVRMNTENNEAGEQLEQRPFVQRKWNEMIILYRSPWGNSLFTCPILLSVGESTNNCNHPTLLPNKWHTPAPRKRWGNLRKAEMWLWSEHRRHWSGFPADVFDLSALLHNERQQCDWAKVIIHNHVIGFSCKKKKNTHIHGR